MGLPDLPGEDFGTLCKKKYWTTPREIDEGLIMTLAQLTVEEVIFHLKDALNDQGNVVLSIGLGKNMSYRGSYDEVAFEPQRNLTISECIQNVENCIDTTMFGYKGGEYECTKDTNANIAFYGSCGTPITSFVMNILLGYHEKACEDG